MLAPALLALASIGCGDPGALASAAQDYGPELVADVAAGREDEARRRVEAWPERSTEVVHELLLQAAEPSERADALLAAARRIAELLADSGRGEAARAVQRFDQLGERGRALRRDVETAHRRAFEEADRARYAQALTHARESLRVARELDDAYLEARASRLVGRLETDLWNLPAAEVALERARLLDEQRGALALVEDLSALGELGARRGELVRARDWFERARLLAGELGLPPPVGEERLGNLYLALGAYEQARAHLVAALEEAQASSRPRAEGVALSSLGALESARGDYTAALRRLTEALRAFRAAGDALGEGTVLAQLGALHSELGRFADARDALERADAALAAGGFHDERARVQRSLGLLLLDEGDPDAALARLDEAQGRLDDGAPGGVMADVHLQRARALLAAGRPADAEADLARALAAESGDPFLRAGIWTALGEARVQDAEGAKDAFERALELARPLGSPESTWRARAGLARLAEARGQRGEALARYREAIADVEAMRTLAAPELRVRLLDDELACYRATARLLVEAGEAHAAFLASQGSKARTLLELAALHAGEAAQAPSPELERAERDLRGARLAFVEGARSAVSAATLDSLREGLARARAAHEAARLELELADPRRAELAGVARARTVEEVQRALGPGEVLVEYSLADEGALAFVVGPRSFAALRLPIARAEARALVARLLDPMGALRRGEVDLANLGFDVRASQELFERLVAPLEDALGNATTLWIVPDDVLRALPFAMLVTDREKRPVDPSVPYAQYSGIGFLVQRAALGSLPAAGLLHHRDGSSRGRPGPVFVFAAPEPAPFGAVRLAATRDEARAIAKALPGARLVTGRDATEASLRAACELAPALLHVASHGVLDDERPAFSRLALASAGEDDGWLHAYEIESLREVPGEVVLSACETAGSAGRGEGLLGLARAFLQRGAHSVVASQWVVDDRASAFLMERLHAARASGLTTVEALRTAQLACLDDAVRGTRGHPFLWAGFVSIGR